MEPWAWRAVGAHNGCVEAVTLQKNNFSFFQRALNCLKFCSLILSMSYRCLEKNSQAIDYGAKIINLVFSHNIFKI